MAKTVWVITGMLQHGQYEAVEYEVVGEDETLVKLAVGEGYVFMDKANTYPTKLDAQKKIIDYKLSVQKSIER